MTTAKNTVVACALMLSGSVAGFLVGFFTGAIGTFLLVHDSGAALAGHGAGAVLLLGMCIAVGIVLGFLGTMLGLFAGCLLGGWIANSDFLSP